MLDASTSPEEAKALTRLLDAFAPATFMCDTLGFSGNGEDFYDPDNSYLLAPWDPSVEE